MIFTGMKRIYKNIEVIAMDLDGTLTQHKTPLIAEYRQFLHSFQKIINDFQMKKNRIIHGSFC